MNPLKKFGSDGKSYPAIIGSSIDSKSLSLTVKSFVVFVPFLTAFLKFSGYDFEEGIFNDLLSSLSEAILAMGVSISAFGVLWGVIRKIAVKFKFYW